MYRSFQIYLHILKKQIVSDYFFSLITCIALPNRMGASLQGGVF